MLERRSFLKLLGATALIPVVNKIPMIESVSAFSRPVDEHLIRSQIWSAQIKEALLKDMISMKSDGFASDSN